jgi:hypothetical protein
VRNLQLIPHSRADADADADADLRPATCDVRPRRADRHAPLSIIGGAPRIQLRHVVR